MRHKFQQLSGSGGDLWLATWEDLAEGDDAPHYSQRGVALTAQVSRDAHGVTILGRIAGDRFFPLNDSDTLPLTFTEPGKVLQRYVSRCQADQGGSGCGHRGDDNQEELRWPMNSH